MLRTLVLFLLASSTSLFAGSPSPAKDLQLLNVSYDPTRELYAEFNASFAKHWEAKTGAKLIQ